MLTRIARRHGFGPILPSRRWFHYRQLNPGCARVLLVSDYSLVVYVKHAHPDSKRRRIDTWLGPILPSLTWFHYQNGQVLLCWVRSNMLWWDIFVQFVQSIGCASSTRLCSGSWNPDPCIMVDALNVALSPCSEFHPGGVTTSPFKPKAVCASSVPVVWLPWNLRSKLKGEREGKF